MRTFIVIEDQEEPEEEAEADDQHALFKHVFDNLRNTVICAVLALAGAGIIKYRRELEFFDSTINAAAGTLLILAVFFLCGWNMVNGYKKIVMSTKGTTRIGLYVLAFLLYGFLAFAVLQAWAMLQAKQPSITVPDTAVERTHGMHPPLGLTIDCSLDPESTCTKNVVLAPYSMNQGNALDSSVAIFLIDGYLPWKETPP